jgi:succinate-semialdehyde dehydrogenase/glutarate-semialdehyde dehydrogenase
MAVLGGWSEALGGRMCIGNAWLEAASGASFEVFDPACGAVLGRVPDAGPGDGIAAVDAAARVQAAWAGGLAGARSGLLRAWAGLIRARRNDLALLLTSEQGKPLAEARGEAEAAAEFIEWFAEEGRRAYGQVVPSFARGKQLVVVREPVGIAVAITPWNFPLSMVARKVAPALAAGCPVVLKPSEDAPLCALALAELAIEAGFPAGLLNVVTCSRAGAAETVKALLLDRRVRKVSFTGSTAVGRLLLELGAQTIKNMSMELGGNAPFVVFDDADPEAALEGFMAAKFRNAGQVCISPNRLLVQQGAHERFVAALARRVGALRVGPGLDEQSQIGPLISQRALDKTRALIEDAMRNGATLMTGGGRHALGGTFLEPTVLTGVHPQMRIFREEIFGPVVPVIRFDTEAQAIALANDTEAGLAAYFYSRDISRCWRVAGAIETGMIGINDGVISTPVAPFGGVKQSGIGREGGAAGLAEYLEEKYLCFGT